MSLFPEEDSLIKEIESWKGFADSLKSEEDKSLFLTMLNDCQKYALAINAKETPFSTEPLIVALLLIQHKMISWLAEQVSKHKYQTSLAWDLLNLKNLKEKVELAKKVGIQQNKGYVTSAFQPLVEKRFRSS
jgi:hypothetical protein